MTKRRAKPHSKAQPPAKQPAKSSTKRGNSIDENTRFKGLVAGLSQVLGVVIGAIAGAGLAFSFWHSTLNTGLIAQKYGGLGGSLVEMWWQMSGGVQLTIVLAGLTSAMVVLIIERNLLWVRKRSLGDTLFVALTVMLGLFTFGTMVFLMGVAY